MANVWKVIKEGKVIRCAEGSGRGNVKQSGQSRSYSVNDAEAGKARPEWVSGSWRRSWRDNGKSDYDKSWENGRILGFHAEWKVESLECMQRWVT